MRTYLPFITVLFFSASFLTEKISAQGQANVWYFGQNAGLDFNSGNPVALTNGQLYQLEGVASISDASGNLLFYTDGMAVWNKQHVTMPNGSGLMGDWSSTQSACIVQKPGSATIYYIFTTSAQLNVGGLRYSEVDMSLCGGLGNVTANKNVLLQYPSCEKICGVRHCNNKDVWLVSHDWNCNWFRAHLVTAAGINLTPVLSTAGQSAGGNSGNTIGQLKCSRDGKRLATATFYGSFEVFDFDNTTGIVSNPIYFPIVYYMDCPYGVEFSPDGSRLYGAAYQTGRLYQFNLCAGSNNAVASSGVLVAQSSTPQTGSLQIGPDNKIYLTRCNSAFMGVISNPNALGTGCSYTDNGVSLGTKKGFYGLPNFIYSYNSVPLQPFTFTINCLNGNFSAPQVNFNTSCSMNTNAPAFTWYFGDPVSGANDTSYVQNPTHVFSSIGTYTVTLVVQYQCQSDTLQQVINTSLPSVAAASTGTACNASTGTIFASASGGTGSYSYLWMPGGQSIASLTGLGTGTYTVIVTDGNNCTASASASVSTFPLPAVHAETTASIPYGTSINLSATGNGTFSWYPPDDLNCTNCADPIASPGQTTEYCVTVTDSNGCTNNACVRITVQLMSDVYVPNAFTPDNDGLNDIFLPVAMNVHDYKLSVYSRWGSLVFETERQDAGWDGTYKGDKCQEDVYVYKIMFTDEEHSKYHEKRGSITLVR